MTLISNADRVLNSPHMGMGGRKDLKFPWPANPGTERPSAKPKGSCWLGAGSLHVLLLRLGISVEMEQWGLGSGIRQLELGVTFLEEQVLIIEEHLAIPATTDP